MHEAVITFGSPTFSTSREGCILYSDFHTQKEILGKLNVRQAVNIISNNK